MRKAMAMFLALCLLLGTVPAKVQAAETPITGGWINPLHTGSDVTLPQVASTDTAAEPEIYYEDLDEAAEYVRQCMKNRQREITVGFVTNDYSDNLAPAVMNAIINKAMQHTGVPDEGDYIARNFSCWSGEGSVDDTLASTVYINYHYTIDFYTTLEQEQEVDQAVDELLAELGVHQMTSDYEKIKAVYDWVCDNVEYDDSLFAQHSTYSAIIYRSTVCQGYASLMYRLILEMGIDCRVVRGSSFNEAHGWNIVKLAGAYFNLDATWDSNYAGNDNYQYFLRNEANFPDHKPEGEWQPVWDGMTFIYPYPMSAVDYIPGDPACKHTNQVIDPAVDAFCFEDGATEGVHCGDCGAVLVAPIRIPYLWHDWQLTVNTATCTVSGLRRYECMRCGIVDEVTGTAPHNAVTIPGKAPTCEEEGLSDGQKCADCGAVITEQTVIPATGKHAIYEETSLPWCTISGKFERGCAECGQIFELKTLEALGHDFQDGVCTRCGVWLSKVLVAPIVKVSNVSSTGKIKLTWNAVEGAAKYKVYRATSKNGTYTLLKTTTGTSLTNTSTTAGKLYYYYVVAVAADGTESEHSTIISRRCDLPRPEVTVSNVASSGKIKISWKAIAGATKYEVYRSTDNKNWTLLKTTTGTSLTNSAAEAGKLYYYKVRAIASNSEANSAYSTVKSRRCDLAQPVVTLSNVASSGKIKISWKAIAGATKYQVYRSTDNKNWTLLKTVTGTSLTNTSTEAGKLYYYKVKAIASNSEANSAYSSVKSRTCDLARPILTVTLNSKGKPILSWGADAGAVKYQVYYSTDGETWTRLISTTGTKLTHSSAASGTTYYYKVYAVASVSSANSAYSTVKSVTAG